MNRSFLNCPLVRVSIFRARAVGTRRRPRQYDCTAEKLTSNKDAALFCPPVESTNLLKYLLITINVQYVLKFCKRSVDILFCW